MKKIFELSFFNLFIVVVICLVSGIGGIFFDLDYFPFVIMPALIFGLLTSWFAFRAENKIFWRALAWVVSSCAIFYASVQLAVFAAMSTDNMLIAYVAAGLFGGFLMSLAAHFLFLKSSKMFKLISAVIGGVAALAFVFIEVMSLGWREFFDVFPFAVWQTAIGIAIFFSLTNGDKLEKAKR